MFFAVIFSVLLALAVGAAPQLVMGLYAEDEAVIREGCGYLRLVAPSYVISAVSTVYLSLCRSVEQVKVPLKINVFALCLNAVLNYIFIFGAFGLPAMGLMGAGLATLLARAVELAAVILFQRNFILRFQLRFLFHFDKPLLKDFVKYSTPVVLNETLWSVGISLHSVMLGKLGYEVLAAYNVAQVLEKLANVAMFGISDATIVILASES